MLLFDPGQHIKKKEIVGRASLSFSIFFLKRKLLRRTKRRSKRRLDRRLVSQELIVGLIKTRENWPTIISS